MIVTISWSYQLAGENNVVSDWFMIVTISLSYPLTGESNVVFLEA